MKNLLTVVCVLVTGFTTTNAQTSAETKMTIENNSKAMENAIKNGDIDEFASYYTQDAMLKLSGKASVEGRDAIKNANLSMTDQGMELRIQSQEIYSMDGYATDLGTYEIYTPDGQKVDEGNYATIWKKVDGKWLIYRDLVSSANGG
ncbi:MAG: nuclear transport factor 2 family protein [Gillisia sp.]